MPELTNPRAERVRSVRALAGRSVRRRRGEFLVEGPQAVREALRFAGERVRAVYLTPDAGQRHPEIVEAAHDAHVLLHRGSPEVLEAMSSDAQHVLAVATPSQDRLDDVLVPTTRLVAVLAHVRDPGNAGTVVRAADAAGADAVVLTAQSVDPYNPKVVRSTAGSLFHLPVVTGVTLVEVIAAARAAGLAVLAADGAGEHDLDRLQDAVHHRLVDRPEAAGVPDLTAATAWVLGNEAWGLREHDRDLADAVVRVPIHGRAESLNLAAAATLCLFASARAQRSAGV